MRVTWKVLVKCFQIVRFGYLFRKIGLKEGAIFMKIINILWISILLIPYINAAFTETELHQLQEIN
ncbi:hypothetical protein BOM24_05340 [Tatumella sp. OPLPL6]|nr:hypothetical protein BOM24_05340 [Tatumella sp. OPLPL6]